MVLKKMMFDKIITNAKSFFLDNRSTRQTIIKNTFWLTVSQLFTRLCSLLVIIWPARYFGPQIYGEFSFAFNFVAFFGIFLDFGLSNILIRGVSRDKSKTTEYIDNVIFLKMILSGIVFLAVMASIYFVKNDPLTVSLVFFLLIYSIISSFAGFLQSIFAANEKMQYMAFCGFLGDLVLLFFIFFFISGGFPIISMSYAYVIAALLEFLLSFVIIWHFFSKFFIKIKKNICLEIMADVWPFGVSSFFTAIYFYFSVILLGVLKSSEYVGWYNIAFKTAFFVTAISGIVFTSFFPSISRFFKENMDHFKHSYLNYASLMYLIAIPVAFGGVTVAPYLIPFLYKYSYFEAIIPFSILSVAACLDMINSVYMACLLSCDKQKDLLLSTLWAAIYNVISGVILVLFYGAIGAAWAVLTTEIILMCFLFYKFSKVASIRFFEILKIPLISSIIMVFAIIGLEKINIYNPIYLVFFAVVIYFLSYFLMYKFFNKSTSI